ncbi:CHAT domain-containing protein [Maribacter algarum]|uniref:CHAT domain-containing protein n=1 Tax=Maribacter algarum (ex Zhang et al. 2020) TaxID=2578118 RepID=A0A5S3PE27_9FLAO|nr:CHAT domain-containing protein [Maribacter algarum]TMM52223.1 CHAT domain-containing protein [Maribacter algarum]
MKKALFILSVVIFNSTVAQNTKTLSLIDSLNEKGNQHYYFERDSAYFYFDKVYFLAKSNEDTENLIQALFNSTGVSSYHHDLSRMGKNILELDSLIKSTIPKDKLRFNENFNILLYYKGTYQLKLYENNNSRKSFEQLIDNVKNIPDSLTSETFESLSSAAYSFLGKIYLLEGKLELAKQLYGKNIRDLRSDESKNFEALYGNYNLLAEVYYNQKNYKKANNFWLKTFEYNKENENINMVISTAFNLTQSYNGLSMKDSALHFLAEAKLNFNNNPAFYPKYHLGKAGIHKKNGEYQMALNELDNAINVVRKRLGNSGNSDVRNAHDEKGTIYMLLGNYKRALQSYDLGVKELNRKDKSFIKLLKNKSITQNKIATKETFISSINLVNEGVQVFNDIKSTFKSQEDKLALIEDVFPLLESGIEAAFKIYDTTKEEKYKEIAFNYLENSKSVLLLEALLSTKATAFANIPNNLLEKERQLKSEINYLKKLLNKKSEDPSNQEEQLFEFQQEYRQLITQFETNYKGYYDLKYNTKTLSLLETQKLLKQDEKLISYFYGNDAIYAIAAGKTSRQFERIPIDAALENTIKQVHKMLGNSKSDVSKLSKASYKLYKNLVAPFVTSNKKKKLIIIADGLLNYIPFGALNTEENGLSYLMESHAISYANSATLYAQLKDRNKKEGNLLAFAPKFSGEQVQVDPSRDKLLPLPHNTREVQQILNSFPGQSYLNENASLQNFTSKLSEYGMVHLATHAVFDDTAPEYSYLAFSNADNQENLLYVSDLYNLQIDADLVTLSACESGVGELKRGEGFLSLARGFFYSGASSLTSTLWKINDASTTTLMDSFYKNLSNGDTKDVAMQKSQISFLESNRQNGLAHPYYWSGFIVSGNTEPLSATNYWFWIELGILLSIVAGFMVFGKKNKN